MKVLHVSIIVLITGLFLSGCINRRGISATYYNDCKEYYDAQGYYHKDCDKNIVDFQSEPEIEETPEQKVW